uniref:Uncharacterized protein n=1 Tax=Parascaris equorum TaxID=6256 RepID=A0A914SHY0_PAREQ
MLLCRSIRQDADSSNKGYLAGNGSADSLRTLLACGEQRVTFHSQVPLCVRCHIISLVLDTFSCTVERRLVMRQPVTLGDVPKDLIAAKKLLRLIADDAKKNEAKKCGSDDQYSLKQAHHSLTANPSTDFVCLFGRRDPLEGLSGCVTSRTWSTEPVNVERMTVVKRPRKGARIVKAIKPLGRPVCITAEVSVHILAPSDLLSSGVSLNVKVVISEGKTVVTSPINEPNLVTNVASTQHLDNSSPTNGANAVKNRSSNTLINSSYVVENNFVTDNKIKVSCNFTAVSNEDKSAQKEDVGDACNSEKDDLSEDDTDERLMDVSEKPRKPAASTARTAGCIGGVPSCVEQWARLLTYYVHIVPAPQTDNETVKVGVKTLCEECAAFFDFGFQMSQRICLGRCLGNLII